MLWTIADNTKNSNILNLWCCNLYIKFQIMYDNQPFFSFLQNCSLSFCSVIFFVVIMNPIQSFCINCDSNVVKITTGPGSGKSHVITSKMINLIHQGVPADKIILFTFTNKAAAVLESRLTTLNEQNLWIGTAHSICCRLLKKYDPKSFVIVDDQHRYISLSNTCPHFHS